MSEYYFQGFWRMDWGLGNPNKTAAIIALLMVFVWVLASIRKWGFWVALALFTALGVCLVHTYSRGGIMAAAAGLAILIANVPRPWVRARFIAIGVSIWSIVGFSVLIQAHERYSQGLGAEDRSISNRLEIWKSAPRMMVDAPDGWGFGESGNAYIQWYQPLERSETYRTLVNSHLTWLVELGWTGRFFYLFVWAFIAALCWPCERTVSASVPLAVWACFFVAATFSSVAESPWLWTIPIAAALLAAFRRLHPGNGLSLRSILVPGTAAAAGCLILYATGASQPSAVVKQGRLVIFGTGEPQGIVVANPKVLGRSAARTFRKHAGVHAFPAFGFADSLNDLPKGNIPLIILTGIDQNAETSEIRAVCARARSIVVVNPKVPPQTIGFDPKTLQELTVIFGEFAQTPARDDWSLIAAVRTLPGIGDFIPDWPDNLLTYDKSKSP